MEIDKIPPMKPVLVEHVSDDINTLQQGDVTKQKTVLTARAIEDIFKCAPIKVTNPTDVGYFVGGKVDLDKIVTACSRTIVDDQYVNGPELKFDKVTGNALWSANHSTEVKVSHAFIYTFSVLDDSTLTWMHYEDDISIDDSHDPTNPNYRSVDPRERSPKIRQIFVPNIPNEYFNITGRSRQDLGTAWTRYGKLVGSSYVWEPWFKMGKTHNGAEYFNQIILAPGAPVGTPLFDSVYHVYSEVPEFVLPNANLDGYIPGMKIIVEVHPSGNSAVSSSCRVVYTDTDNQGENAQTPMNIFITPKVRRNTKDIFGNVRDDVQITSVACFEIVEINEGDKKFRTWELDGGVEETDFTAGLAQMLGEHTDQSTGDIVQYNNDTIKGQKSLDILYPVTTSGWTIARFLKHEAIADLTWVAQVEILTPTADADFVHVDNTTTPVATQVYYVRTGTVMSLAENDGHPTSFIAANDYYTLSATCPATSVIQFSPEGSTVIRTDIKLADLELDQYRGFSAFVHRNCVIRIRISAEQTISVFQNKVFPVVKFYHDPHDSYVQKQSINPSAYTWKQLEKLFYNGGIINDTSLAWLEFDQSLANAPASTRALLEAYHYLASKLQHRGLLLGNRAELNVEANGFDKLVGPGYYYVTPKFPGSEFSTYPPGLTAAGCNLMIVGNDHAPVGHIHEEEGGIIDPTKVMQIAVVMGTPMEIYTRIGTKQEDGTWTWSAWRAFLDWIDIHGKPLYFHARWDYFESPDKVLNRLDNTEVTTSHNTETSHLEVITNITEDEIKAIMEASADPQWDENVNYDVPQYMVGIHTLEPTAWESQKLVSETGIDYVVNVRLPKATASELSTDAKTRRRKIRFLFYGAPGTNWSQVLFRLSFGALAEESEDYTYERNWGGSYESIIVLEFEQMDLPNGERVWCPHEIG